MRWKLISSLVAVGWASAVWGQNTVTLNPSLDAFVSSANPNNNYGKAGALAVSASGLSKGELLTYMEFNFSSVPTTFNSDFLGGPWTITSVTLKLTSASPNNAIFNSSAAGTIDVDWISDDSWTEGTGTPMSPTTSGITFNNQPSSSGEESAGSFSFNGGTSGANTYSISLASGLLNDIDNGASASTLELLPGDSVVSGVFNSKDFSGSSSNFPLLTITAVAVPEPTGLCLLITPGLLLLRRWRA